MKLENLKKLYIEELQDLWSAESQLIKAIPKMADAANETQLRKVFDNHLRETKTQLERLEQILERLQARGKGKTCKGMEGVIAEGSDFAKAAGDPAVVDAALIAAAQRVEHYEIASYGCAKTYAGLLGLDADAQLLEESLAEEKAADASLNELAVNLINLEAAAA